MNRTTTHKLLAILLSLIMVLGLIPMSVFAIDLPIITGNSVYRSSATTATAKLLSDTNGTAYFSITDSAIVPSASDLTAWTYAGDVVAGVTKSMALKDLPQGAKYVHMVVSSADGLSNVLTVSMPQDYFYHEDFEAYYENTYVSQSGSFLAPISQQYGGNGDENQKVVSASGNKYFSLTSNSTASVQRIHLLPNYRDGAGKLVLKGKVMPLSEGPTWQEAAMFGIGDRKNGVLFINGKICYADKKDINNITYDFNQWYEIELDINLKTNKYNIKINGTTVATDVIYDDSQKYVTIFAGHSTTAYFDDISFYTIDDNPLQSIEDKTANVSDTVYTGNEQKQPVTIEGLAEGTDFDVTYSADCTNVGTVTVTITGKGNYFGVLTVTYQITQADRTAPVAPSAQSIGKNSITLTAVDGCEYSKNGTAWQDSNIFDGLSVSTPYTFYQRYKETANYKASPASESVIFTTDYGDAVTDMYSIPSANGEGWYNTDITVKANSGYSIGKTADSFGTSILLNTETDNGSQVIFVRDTSGLIYKTTLTYKLDKTSPADTRIQYKSNGFKAFLNTITFGLFFKETVDAEATATDALSGMASVEYYSADSEIADVTTITDWQSSLSIAPNSKKIVYVRFTDKAGNVTVCKDQGVVVYTDSAVSPKSSTFDKDASKQTDITFTFTLNGNTLRAVKNGTSTLIGGTDYTVSENAVSVKKAYFARFNKGDSVTLTFCFDPMGVETDTVTLEDTATVSIIDTTHIHDWASTWSKDGTHHWHDCEADGCTVSDSTYKDGYAAHDYNQTTVQDATTLVSVGTCKDNAVYKYTCVCGAVGTATYEKPDSKNGDNHTVTTFTYTSNGDGKHTKNHECCGTAAETANCSGGKATCTAKTVCEYCKGEYGDVLPHTPDREAPTETEPVKCTECGYMIEPATGHIHKGVFIPEKPATAEATGTKAHYECGCGKLFGDAACNAEITAADLVIPKLAPTLLDGANGKAQIGSGQTLSFRYSAALTDFISVSVDGAVIDGAEYTLTNGSTIVTLKADYLSTLSVGEHELTISFNTGSVTTTFTIEAEADIPPIPQTGDNGSILLWITLLFVSGTILTRTIFYDRKKRYSI